MADPLAILTGTITCGDALIRSTNALVQLISKIRNAPQDLLSLKCDITDIKGFLHDILDHARDENIALANLQASGTRLNINRNKAPADVLRLIKRAEINIVDLQSVVAKTTVAAGANGVKVKKKAWLCQSIRLNQLRRDLQDIKGCFSFHFASKSSTYSFRSTLILEQVQMESSRMWTSNSRENEEIRRFVDGISQQIQGLTALPEEQKKMNLLLEQLSKGLLMSAEITPPDLTPTTTTNTPEEPSPNAIVRQSYAQSPLRNAQTVERERMVSRLKLQFSRFTRESCSEFCSCICHVRSRYQSPSVLSKFMGSLRIGLSGLPTFGQGCTEPSCYQRTKFSATFTYQFPTWFYSRMMTMLFFTTTQGDLGACLQFRPLVTNFSIYRLSSIGDILGLQRLLGEKKAHPSEGFYGGWTPLHYAISYGHATVCRLLLQQGADPMREDGENQVSALEYAWTKILGGAFPEKTSQEMEVLFNDRDCLEEFGFSTTHKIILGLNGKSLEEHLQDDLLELNVQDHNGRTPLSWAAQRGDLNKVQILLEYGADPNICTPRGHSPLQFASQSRSFRCIEALLRKKADPQQSDPADQNPLHYTLAKPIDDVQYLKLHIAAGIDVNKPTNYDYTPLIMAAEVDSIRSAKLLIEKGAIVNLKGQLGKTPLFFTIEFNATRCLKLLHKHGADFTTTTENGSTIFHFAAEFASKETLDILAGFQLRIPEEIIKAKNHKGLTAVQVLTDRQDPKWNEVAQAFQSFVDSVDTGSNNNYNNNSHSNEANEDDVFYDAEEVTTLPRQVDPGTDWIEL